LSIIAEIQKIDRFKKSRTESLYVRVHFKTERHKYAQTDLVSTYRNFDRWRDLLVVGNVLGGLDMIGLSKIDGDSRPHLVKAAPVPASVIKQEQAELFG
jgi:hypothetical protein